MGHSTNSFHAVDKAFLRSSTIGILPEIPPAKLTMFQPQILKKTLAIL